MLLLDWQDIVKHIWQGLVIEEYNYSVKVANISGGVTSYPRYVNSAMFYGVPPCSYHGKLVLSLDVIAYYDHKLRIPLVYALSDTGDA